VRAGGEMGLGVQRMVRGAARWMWRHLGKWLLTKAQKATKEKI